jgi:hypothetical protein
MMDYDELLSDNHSPSINQLNHSSDSMLGAVYNRDSRWRSLSARESISITISIYIDSDKYL